MKAAEYSRFGPPDVLEVVERPRPTPGATEVLVRVHATTVTTAECHMRRGRPLWGRVILGFRRPRRRMRRLGLEFAGEVVEVGSGVTRCAPGDEIFGFTGFRLGAAAEYLCLPQSASFAPKPAGVPFARAAAAVDGSTTALYFLQGKAHVRAGQRVLVVGASGSIGSYAVQLAHRFGAEVTGVCSGRNADLVRSLGASHVVDHTRTDFTTTGERYDVIFDTVGRSSFARSRGSLTARGCYLSTSTGSAEHAPRAGDPARSRAAGAVGHVRREERVADVRGRAARRRRAGGRDRSRGTRWPTSWRRTSTWRAGASAGTSSSRS